MESCGADAFNPIINDIVHRHFETPLLRAQSGSGELRAEGTWLSKLMGRNIV
jgi:hypothetical protein